jgi:hypothetical protein
MPFFIIITDAKMKTTRASPRAAAIVVVRRTIKLRTL